MNRIEILERKIFLRKQHIGIIKDRIKEMENERKELIREQKKQKDQG